MSKLGDELVQSMAQALAHAQGKRNGSRTHQVAIKPDEIQRAPTGAAKTLLKIIEREPKAVRRALKVA